MAFCASCGTQVEGKFCPKCGAAISEGGGSAAPAAVPVAQSGMADNVASALCYLFSVLTGILFLVLEPYNKNKGIRFHAFQAIFLGVACIAIWIALMIVNFLLVMLGSLGAMLITLLWYVFVIGYWVVAIMLMVKAYQNQKWVLPIIGPLAEKQAG